MASCVVCHNEPGWSWRTVATNWAQCRQCGVYYCGNCFRSLGKATRGDRWWSRKTVRICRECRADIQLPMDPAPIL